MRRHRRGIMRERPRGWQRRAVRLAVLPIHKLHRDWVQRRASIPIPITIFAAPFRHRRVLREAQQVPAAQRARVVKMPRHVVQRVLIQIDAADDCRKLCVVLRGDGGACCERRRENGGLLLLSRRGGGIGWQCDPSDVSVWREHWGIRHRHVAVRVRRRWGYS